MKETIRNYKRLLKIKIELTDLERRYNEEEITITEYRTLLKQLYNDYKTLGKDVQKDSFVFLIEQMLEEVKTVY